MADDVVISVDGLWKRYGPPLGPVLRGAWRRLRSGTMFSPAGFDPEVEGPWALRDVNLQVRRGETLGIIGRNGAGKSTLLKVLAGVTPPTRGRVVVKGRIFPMIELQAGIHLELTGRENVRLLGAIMGLSRQQIRGKLPEIEEFCELGPWFDEPVRKYSSGMLARLGFGVAMNVEADVLLVDEVLAVGDLSFQRKCIERVGLLKSSGVTVLLVSHAIRQAERVCQEAVLLDQGSVAAVGEMREVASRYYQETLADELRRVKSGRVSVVYANAGVVHFEAIEIWDAAGRPADSVEVGKAMSVVIRYRLQQPVRDLAFHIGFVTSDMLRITTFNSLDEPFPPGCESWGVVECHIEKVPLMPGTYGLYVSVTCAHNVQLFKGENLAFFQVTDPSFHYTRRNTDLFALDVRWRFVPGGTETEV